MVANRGTIGRMVAVALVAAACAVWAQGVSAQDYGGTYTAPWTTGTLTLQLVQDAAGRVTGTLTGPDIAFELDGVAYPADGFAAGSVYTAEGTAGFEAYLEGDMLGLYLFELDADGAPIVDTATEVILTRHAAASPAAEGAGAAGNGQAGSPAAPATGNPLGADPPSAPAPDPFAGQYSDGALTVELEPHADGYRGALEFQGQSYDVTARPGPDGLAGEFGRDGSSFAFTATLEGDTLSFATGGATYALPRTSAAAPANPPGAGAAAPGDGPVIARGAFAELTEDDALAFIEALEFSLAQAGYAYTFTAADRQQMLAAIVEAYPRADQEEQVVMARAREIWTDVRANWAQAADADKRAFVLAVFTLAFGEEAVQQATGAAQGGGGGGGCATFEDCAGAYMDGDTYQDAQNAQSCWAAAGCGSYDAGSDTFYDVGGDPY